MPVRTGVALEKLLWDGARPCAYQPHVDLEPYSLRTSLTDAARASRGRPAIHFVNVASRTRYERDFTQAALAAAPATTVAHAHIGRRIPKTEGGG